MQITITDNSGYLAITDADDTTRRYNIMKNNITVISCFGQPSRDDMKQLRIYTNDGNDGNKHVFRFDTIVSPSYANVYDLADYLTGLVDTTDDDKTTGTFTNADLVAGILTIPHSKGKEVYIASIEDPDGQSELYNYVNVDADTVTIDFGGAIAVGTWSYVLIHK